RLTRERLRDHLIDLRVLSVCWSAKSGHSRGQLPRIRAPMSMRGPWLAGRAAAPAIAIGQTVFSNRPSKRSGTKRHDQRRGAVTGALRSVTFRDVTVVT